jgi:predicted aspartyl protease
LPAEEQCRLLKLADVPVSLEGRQPVITAKINGVDAVFAVDSGAFWSTLSTAAAQQYGLDLDRAGTSGIYIQGIGGNVALSVATVKVFTIFNVPVKNMEFVVVNSDMGGGTAGLLGQNILRIADIEYDLAHGMIRFFRSDRCEHTDLAYWVKPGDSYSAMKIESATITSPHIAGEADFGGKKLRVMFDTGSSTSILNTTAAKRAGITPDSPGVTPAGEAIGLGRKTLPTWTATFASFKIGDEEIRHARLRFGNIGPLADMLLGADFFLSHRYTFPADGTDSTSRTTVHPSLI